MKLQPLTKLERKLRAELRRLGAENSAVLVAVSGGADSVALLDALARWRARQPNPVPLCVAHLNHQLRGAEADADAEFVRELALRLGLPAVIEQLDVQAAANATRQNLEATARRLRYEFLQRAAQLCQTPIVLTAHTQDDQAETVLMRLLRGSGAAGLRGIHPQVLLSGDCQLLRPCLKVTRAEVLAHCAQHNLVYRTDSSNLSPDFTRNRIRHELLPLLRTFNPRSAEVLERTAELLAAEDAYLELAAQGELAAISASERKLSVPLLLAQPLALQRRILKRWGQAAEAKLETVHLAALEKLIRHGQSGRIVELPGGWRVMREFDWLRLRHITEIMPPVTASLVWRTAEPVQFNGYEFSLRRELSRDAAAQFVAAQPEPGLPVQSWSAMLRESQALDELELRTRRAGDAYAPAQRQTPVKLKTLLIRHKIAKPERAEYPILSLPAGGIVWGPGLPVAAAFTPLPDTQRCAVIMAREA
jgi:tRNA(Ile)-lysidine synthase